MLLLIALPNLTYAAYYIKYEGVDGEAIDSSAPGVEPDEIDARTTDDGDSAKGNVETEFKVEKGESAAPGVEPDEIDSKFNSDNAEETNGDEDQPIITGQIPNTEQGGIEPDEIDDKFSDDSRESTFAILLSGAGEDKPSQAGKKQIEDILLQGAHADDVPMEEISLNFEKIESKVKQEVKLFGFIPIQATATVEIDKQERVKVKFPWWAFFASGKNKEGLGGRVFQTLTNVLETKHEAIKVITNNIK